MKIQSYRRAGPVTVIQPQRDTLIIPAFQLEAQQWLGANRLIMEIPIGNNYVFSFKLPLAQFGVNFVAAVRWMAGSTVIRFKFWDDNLLYCPIYNGEAIGLGAVIEIWSINTGGVPINFAPQSWKTSVLLFTSASSCRCRLPSGSTTLVAADPTLLNTYENPFDGQVQGIDDDDTEEGDGVPDEGDPGGGIPTITQFLADHPGDYFEFPCSAYCVEASNPTYPDEVTSAQASFWVTLLNNEWHDVGMDGAYSERHLAWLYLDHIVSFYSFLDKYNSGNAIPSAGPNNWTEFAAPWSLTYLWKPI